ncbi:MAG: hypothetical protein IJP23_02020 [Oscillospiraceae bacterium]|nr:hypothetical protein [Oscillospiraceae bacterium]
MKPVYCNTFNITHDKGKSEIALNFNHIYTEHNYTIKEGGLTDVSAQVVDEVASIQVSRAGFLSFVKLCNKIVRDLGIDPDEL